MEIREDRVEEMCRNHLVGFLRAKELGQQETFIHQISEGLLSERCCSGH